MAYGYHRGINECYACTSSESSQIKEEPELEEHAAFQLQFAGNDNENIAKNKEKFNKSIIYYKLGHQFVLHLSKSENIY